MDKLTESKDVSHIINHLGEERENYFNAMSPPVIQTSNFVFNNTADLAKAFEAERATHLYTRGNNPTVTMLAKKIAALEGAEDALLVGSGAAAISNAVIPFIGVGDHIICVKHVYAWANKLMTVLLPRFGVTTTFVDGIDVENFKNAIQPNTKIIFLESPNSIVMELQDLKAIATLAKANNIITVLDNSYATPLCPSPFDKGIDLVLHSATKYIGGHSDVVAGVISGSKALIDKIFESEFMTLGNILHPHDAWLLMRGLRTLPIRVKQSSETTIPIVQYFLKHPKVKRVFYPHLKNNAQYELALQQMALPMGMFTVAFDASRETINAFCDALNYFMLAVSWGGHESLALPITLEHRGETFQVVRFYIGLETFDLLMKDIIEAMKVFEIDSI